jgi:hypothetical protein
LIFSIPGAWAAGKPDTAARLAALEATVTTLQGQVNTLNTTVATLQTQVANGISVAVHGRIDPLGNSGTGFTVSSSSTGWYNVSFITPFSTTPQCFAQADEQVVICSAYSTNTNGTQIWCRQPAAGYESLWYDPLGVPYLTVYGLTPWTWDGAISFICVQ